MSGLMRYIRTSKYPKRPLLDRIITRLRIIPTITLLGPIIKTLPDRNTHQEAIIIIAPTVITPSLSEFAATVSKHVTASYSSSREVAGEVTSYYLQRTYHENQQSHRMAFFVLADEQTASAYYTMLLARPSYDALFD
jgi:hypothetical protein